MYFKTVFFLLMMMIMFTINWSLLIAENLNFDDLRERSNLFFLEEKPEVKDSEPTKEIDADLSIDSVLTRGTNSLLASLPKQAKIVVLGIQVYNSELRNYITFELEHLLQKANHIIIDRDLLPDTTLQKNLSNLEQFDDLSASNLGESLGANIVITGIIHGEGELRRLRLKALNVQTAQVIASVSEKLDPFLKIGSAPQR